MIEKLLARLARVTSSGLFLPEVDGLRFFAIASVLVFHVSMGVPHQSGPPFQNGIFAGFCSLLVWLFDRGFFGVRLFFVISGFILALPFAAHYLEGETQPSLRRYYLRRLTRLEPPYMVSLAICYVLLMLGGLPAAIRLTKNLAASAAYSHWAIFGQISRVNGVLWSLECEVQFYMLAPLIALIFTIRSDLMRRASFALVPLLAWGGCHALRGIRHMVGQIPWYHPIRAAGLGDLALNRVLIFTFLAYFCAGFVIADVFLKTWRRKPGRGFGWDILGTAAWFLLALSVRPEAGELQATWRDFLLYPPLIAVGFASAFKGRCWNLVVRNRWLVTIGGMCYTIYLYHQVVILRVLPWTQTVMPNILVEAGLLFTLCVGIASILFVLFEKPFMYRDWPSRWRAALAARLGWRKQTPAATKVGIAEGR